MQIGRASLRLCAPDVDLQGNRTIELAPQLPASTSPTARKGVTCRDASHPVGRVGIAPSGKFAHTENPLRGSAQLHSSGPGITSTFQSGGEDDRTFLDCLVGPSHPITPFSSCWLVLHTIIGHLDYLFFYDRDMSTRRSTRNSLPTPARSVAAPSTAASTPIATAPAQVKAQLAGKIDTGSATLAMAPGLITPASMVDDQEVELETDQDEGEAIAVASGATSRSAAARKRKGESGVRGRDGPLTFGAADPEDTDPEADSPFNSSSPASGSTQPTRPGIKRKYTLDSVSIPTRRSKLGQDKTGSSDNLTLGSPVSKNGALGDVILKSEPMDEVPPAACGDARVALIRLAG